MDQKIESKVEAPKTAVPSAKEVKVQPKKEVSKETTTEHHQETKSVFVKKKSQFADYKLFNRWSFDDVVVSDLSLVKYINLDPVVVPH